MQNKVFILSGVALLACLSWLWVSRVTPDSLAAEFSGKSEILKKIDTTLSALYASDGIVSLVYMRDGYMVSDKIKTIPMEEAIAKTFSRSQKLLLFLRKNMESIKAEGVYYDVGRRAVTVLMHTSAGGPLGSHMGYVRIGRRNIEEYGFDVVKPIYGEADWFVYGD